jgi:serine/threonine protein kinase
MGNTRQKATFQMLEAIREYIVPLLNVEDTKACRLPTSLREDIELHCPGVAVAWDAVTFVSSRNLVIQAREADAAVALKLCLPEASTVFENEVGILSLLTNAGAAVPRLLSLWRLECGICAFTMPWYPLTLVDAVNERRLSRRGAWSVVRAVASVYLKAHALGVTHCDLKPDNIYMCDGDGGACVVADWDLACNNMQAEQAKLHVGTEGFNAPSAFAISCVSTEADVFRLGTVMYAMLYSDVPRWHWRRRDKLQPHTHFTKAFDDVAYSNVMLTLLQQTGTVLSLATVEAAAVCVLKQ